MPTLAAWVKESDEFNLDVLSRQAERTSWRGALQNLGVCLLDTDTCGDVFSVFRRISDCRTYGDVMDALSAVGEAEVETIRQGIWDMDMEAARRAWEAEYIVSEAVLDLVAKQLEDYSSNWNMLHWYAPLVALVQSSGWGKSRLICQLWRKELFVFYISCMGEKQTGFPRRTWKLADILQSSKASEGRFVALVLSILTVFNKHADMTSEQWIQAQEKSNEIQEEVHAVYEEKLPGITSHDKLNRADAERQFRFCFQDEINKLEGRKVKLLLCVDEAGELGENFVKFRRSLRSIPQGNSFFCIVLGTDRKVADFAAAAAADEDDASARVRLATPYKVYPPLYLIGKSDIFAKASSEAETSTARETVIRYGRPLWAAYYDSLDDLHKVTATIQLGKMKLLGKNINTSEAGWVTRDIAVAVFACIVGLDVVAWGTLPQQLVAKHMRTIVNISEDRRRVYTAAAVEPALAAAAAELLHAKNDAFLGVFLDRLIEVFLDGLVLEGVRGEVVTRIIIMLAMHECTKSGYYIRPVTLATFLETMFGKRIVDNLKANCCNLDGPLFFNSFTPISAEPCKELIDAAFARCTALIARRNESTMDSILPTRIVPSDVPRTRPMQKTVEWEQRDQEGKGAGVSVQAKNVRDNKSMEKAIEKLQDEERMSTPVQLFLQIGHRGESRIEVDSEAVVAYGFDCFEHLKSPKMLGLKVRDKLKLLSRTCEDVFKGATSEERRILEDMVPLGCFSKSFLEDMEVDDNAPWIPMKWKTQKKRMPRQHHQSMQMGEAAVEDVQMGEADIKEN